MRRTLPLVLLVALLLAACGRQAPAQGTTPTAAPAADAPTSMPTEVPAPSATVAPITAQPTPTPPLPTVPVATLTAELSATVVAALPPTATTAPGEDAPLFAGIDSVNSMVLEVPTGEQPLWLVSSAGYPDIERNQRHFIAIYTHNESGWQELARHEVENADALLEGGVEQVQISSDRIWLLVQSGIGAHSGCMEVLSFDGSALTKQVAGCNSSPVAGFLQDFDGDGFDEVVVNRTDNYVFCYACGERFFSYQLFYWDGSQMQGIDLQATPPGARGDALYDAVVLARLGMWKDAQALIAQAPEVRSDRLAKLYAATIAIHAQDFADQVQNAQFPLLDQLFYGDYAAALDVLRAYPPDQLFTKPSPLIAGTLGEGWDGSVTYWITDTTTLVIDSNIGDSIDNLPAPARSIDTLAAAHFLRGWALTLSDPPAPEAITDIEQAVQLKPDDPFFQAALDYLKQ